MSQSDTYRPAVLPSEAVMIPAAEAAEETAENQTPAQETQKAPRRNGRSASLEQSRMQSRMLASQRLTWMNTQNSPLDGGQTAPERQNPVPGRILTPSSTPLTRRNATISQGSALSTLMRSAARRYTPPPMMRMPTAWIDQPAPMRGALRSVVMQAHSSAAQSSRGKAGG